jgi:hypothetical protein
MSEEIKDYSELSFLKKLVDSSPRLENQRAASKIFDLEQSLDLLGDIQDNPVFDQQRVELSPKKKNTLEFHEMKYKIDNLNQERFENQVSS